MNMGAGILLRTVSRAAGSTAPAGSNVFCSSCTGQVTRPSSLRSTSSCRSGHADGSGGPLCQQAATSPTPVEFDDWEFADDPFVDSGPNSLIPRAENRAFVTSSSSSSLSAMGEDPPAPDNHFWHVFGMPPSFEEANAATIELEAALFPHGASTHKDSGGEDDPRWGGSAWVEPHLYMSNHQMVQLSRSPVQEAFELLQSDPNVKGAVISIVSDPDVWSAMMKNQKVQELKCILERSQGRGEESVCSSSLEEQPLNDIVENQDWINGVSHVFSSIMGASKQVLFQVHEDISKFIMSIFAAFSGSAGLSKKDDPFDKMMSSSMMLAMLVVTVVVLKRLHI